MDAIRLPDGRDRTQRFYEDCSQEYANATRRRVLMRALDSFARMIGPEGSILDLGCGAGHDLSLFGAKGRRAVGLDYAAAIAKLAREESRAPVVVGDMRAIPFGDGTFDGVWASASLLHLPREDLGTALGEIKRVLKRRGILFASVKLGEGAFRDVDGRYFTLYDRKTFRAALSSADFEQVTIRTSAKRTGGSACGARGWMTSISVAA